MSGVTITEDEYNRLKSFEKELLNIRNEAEFQASKQYHEPNIREPWEQLRFEIDLFLSKIEVG